MGQRHENDVPTVGSVLGRALAPREMSSNDEVLEVGLAALVASLARRHLLGERLPGDSMPPVARRARGGGVGD